jgi:hypothetical protein
MLLSSFRREQLVQPLAVKICQPIGQLLVDAAVGACDRLCADTFDRVQARKKNRSLEKSVNQLVRKHHAFVRLHRRFDQFLDGELVMGRREWFKTESCLKFDQMLSPRLGAAAVLGPGHFTSRACHFKSLTDAIDTGTASGHFFFHVMESFYVAI